MSWRRAESSSVSLDLCSLSSFCAAAVRLVTDDSLSGSERSDVVDAASSAARSRSASCSACQIQRRQAEARQVKPSQSYLLLGLTGIDRMCHAH